MLVLIAGFLGSLSGCGDSADPLKTGIIEFHDASTGVIITSITTSPGGSVTLVVRVRNLRSDGTTWVPVIGEKVTFTLLTPGNGGGLTVVNDRTAGNGQAMAVFTAGNNSATDSVRATTGSGATASITITKTGGIVGARISTLTASATTVGGYQTSTVTATVTDGNSPANPILGEPVTFTIPMNQSGACFITASLACVESITVNTDASGHAVALYRGGLYDPYSDASDTVRAALANGSSNALVIIRSGGTPLSIAVEASPTSVPAGGTSIITATLTGSGNAGVLVNFTIPVNNSGATLSAFSAVTDGSGRAVVTYIAGASDPMMNVSDSVQAVVGYISASVVITRSASTPLAIAVAASPSVVTAGGTSIITATLTGDRNVGVLVNLSIPINNSGASLSASSAVTDGTGKAVVSYSAGGNDPLLTIGDTVQASVGDISGAAAITWTGAGAPPPTTPLAISVAASPTSVGAGQVSIITATVTGGTNAGAGETVTFTLPGNNSGASLSASSAVTDGSGRAVVTYTAGSNNPTQDVSDTVRAALGNISSSATITRTGSATPPPLTISVAAVPASVNAGQASIVTATLTGTNNSGVTVSFALSVNNSGATLSAATAITDGAGRAVVVYTSGANNPTLNVTDTVQASVGSISSAAVITRTGSVITPSYSVTVTAAPTALTSDNGNSIITAQVLNNGVAVSGQLVTFTVTGTPSGGNVVGSVLPVSANTNLSGNAVVIFTGGGGTRPTGETDVVTASITIGAATYSGAAIITYP